MDDDGLPKGIRNRNDVGTPSKQSKTAIIAVAIAIISFRPLFGFTRITRDARTRLLARFRLTVAKLHCRMRLVRGTERTQECGVAAAGRFLFVEPIIHLLGHE
jgi:hypothetical protein